MSKAKSEIFDKEFERRKKQFLSNLSSQYNLFSDASKHQDKAYLEQAIQGTKYFIEYLDYLSPPSLKEFLSLCQQYIAGTVQKHEIVIKYGTLIEEIKNIQSTDFGNDDFLNIEDIYLKAKQESRIDEFFEKIIGILQKIIDDKLIGDLHIIDYLTKIVSNMRKSKNESFFNFSTVFRFAINFIKNYLFAQFGTFLPEEIVSSLKEAVNETEKEFSNVTDKANTEVETRLVDSMPESIKEKIKPLELLSYNQNAEIVKLLPSKLNTEA